MPAEAASPLRGPAAAVGRCLHLCAVYRGRKPAADRSRYDVADHRRAMDSGSSHGAGNRRLFLHHARPALDLDAVAGAGDVCEGLRDRPAGAAPVVLAASAIAATFALLTKFLTRRLSDSTTLVFVAAALALTVPHLLARPHVLALPLMVAWVGGMIAAADRRGAPSFWLLPVMALWANLHGGFVFGLVLIAPIALDAVLSADVKARKALALRWAAFALAALLLSCCTPYGWNSLLASQKILGARRRAAADQGMAAGGFRQRRRARNLPAARNWAGAVARHPTAAAAHRAAVGTRAHGARPGPRRRNPGAAGAAHSRRTAGKTDRRRRGLTFKRRAAATRHAVRRRRGAAAGRHICLYVGASLRAAHPWLAGRRRRRAEKTRILRASSTITISAAI